MKLITGSLFVTLLAMVGCDRLNKDDDSPSGSTGPALVDFSLTGNEVTEVKGPQVVSFVNSTPLLQTFKFSKIQLATNVSSQAGRVSRRPDGIATCIQTTIKNHPLKVTNDSVGYDMSLDFVTICDTKAKPEDLVDEVVNKLTASMTIGCAGRIIADKFKGKTVGDLENTDNICGDASAITFSYSYKIDARRTTKTKQGSESEVTGVSVVLMSQSLAAPNGGPCVLNIDPSAAGTNHEALDSESTAVTTNGDRHLSACRLTAQSKTFSGNPKDESNSPRETTSPHPVVLQSVVDISGATMKPEVPFYVTANTTFKFNGWEGVVTHLNGWASPKWEAKFPGTSAKVEGEIGAAAPQNTGGGNSNNGTVITPPPPESGSVTIEPTPPRP